MQARKEGKKPNANQTSDIQFHCSKRQSAANAYGNVSGTNKALYARAVLVGIFNIYELNTNYLLFEKKCIIIIGVMEMSPFFVIEKAGQLISITQARKEAS